MSNLKKKARVIEWGCQSVFHKEKGSDTKKKSHFLKRKKYQCKFKGISKKIIIGT